jgi:hypothetical protein
MATLPTSRSRPSGANWDDWTPPPCPDISDVDFWPEAAPWTEKVRGRLVDTARTKRLTEAGVDKGVRHGANPKTKDGVRGGYPFQRIDNQPTRTRRVYESKVPPSFTRGFFPSTMVPLPDLSGGEYVRRFGDPTVTGTDAGAIFLDAEERTLYEISAFGPTNQDCTTWRSGRVTAWDLDRDWRDQPGGLSASRVPLLPMLPTFEQYESGDLGHALHLSLAGYAKEAPVGFSRGHDGEIQNHPLRNGERLRLTEAALLKITSQQLTLTAQDRVLLHALYTYGVVLTDRTSQTVDHTLRQPMDPRIVLNVILRLTDFEVLLP